MTLLIAFLVVSVGAWQMLFYDGLFGIWLPMDTEYAPKYDERAFRRIRVGMTRQQVLDLIGEPLAENQSSNETYLIYSRSPSSTNYRCRAVVLHDGLVVQVHHEIYID